MTEERDILKKAARYQKRMKKEFGQSFWWRPGELWPARAQDLRNSGGQ